MTMSSRRLAALLIALPLGMPAAAQQELLPPLPRVGPERAPAQPAIEPDSGDGAVIAGTGGAGFELGGIVLEGATAIPTEELRPIWADQLGDEVTVAELQAIAGQIGAAYRARGFVLSQAVLPAQSVEGGVVRIAIVEGFVDEVEIAGGAPNQQRIAEKLFAPLPAERPLRLRTLERSVLLSRDTFGSTYGGTVETVLEPSPDVFGAADLGVLISPEPFSGFVTADNRGSRLYGDLTLGAGTRSYNVLGLNERIDLLLAAAPEGRSLGFGALAVSIPVEPLVGTALDGAAFEVDASISRADPDLDEVEAADGLTSILDERRVEARMVVPFVRTRTQSLYGRLGLELLESESETGLDGETFEELDRLAVIDARLTWDFADTYGGISLVDVGLRQGLDIGGTEVAAEGPAAGEPDFTLVELSLSRLQSIPGAPGWSLYGEVTGQYAPEVLPAAERFFLGGSTIGRGFAPGNTSGDTGFGGRVELRRAVSSPPRGYVDAAELYAFGDWGRAYDRSISRDGDQWEELGSVGIGARVDVRPWLSITPEVVRQVAGAPADTDDDDLETRFFLGATARF
jgi:hemolysin activation/secretion protein